MCEIALILYSEIKKSTQETLGYVVYSIKIRHNTNKTPEN